MISLEPSIILKIGGSSEIKYLRTIALKNGQLKLGEISNDSNFFCDYEMHFLFFLLSLLPFRGFYAIHSKVEKQTEPVSLKILLN